MNQLGIIVSVLKITRIRTLGEICSEKTLMPAVLMPACDVLVLLYGVFSDSSPARRNVLPLQSVKIKSNLKVW